MQDRQTVCSQPSLFQSTPESLSPLPFLKCGLLCVRHCAKGWEFKERIQTQTNKPTVPALKESPSHEETTRYNGDLPGQMGVKQ